MPYHASGCKLGVRPRPFASLLIVLGLADAVTARSLPDLLAAVAADARFDVPARADVTISCTPGCTPPHRRAVFVGRGSTLFVEVKDGPRALLAPDRILVAGRGAPAPAAPGARFAGTDLLLEDLIPFTTDALKLPLISDDGPAGVVVTGAPARPSAYVLLVLTIHPEERTILKTQQYQESIGNLTRIRRESSFTDVGGHRRPGEITLEALRKGTTTRLTLTWREMADAPAALFEPGGLEKPSGMGWPAEP
jgi:hypothetical protein